jgi:hypothetical protein
MLPPLFAAAAAVDTSLRYYAAIRQRHFRFRRHRLPRRVYCCAMPPIRFPLIRRISLYAADDAVIAALRDAAAAKLPDTAIRQPPNRGRIADIFEASRRLADADAFLLFAIFRRRCG